MAVFRDAEDTVHAITWSAPVGTALCGFPPVQASTGVPWPWNAEVGRALDPYDSTEVTCIFCLRAQVGDVDVSKGQ